MRKKRPLEQHANEHSDKDACMLMREGLISMQVQALTTINMLEYLSAHKGTHLCVHGSSMNPSLEIISRPSITFVKIGNYCFFFYIL